MSLKISNLILPVEQPEQGLPELIARQLGLRADDLGPWRILRKSLDARQRSALKFVYTVEVSIPGADEAALRTRFKHNFVDTFAPNLFDEPTPGVTPLPQRPIVVGSGPAGLLAGYYLALRGYRPLIIERGDPVKTRVPAIRLFDAGGAHDPENNYLFGEGGAGTFSDGKLTCRMSGPDVEWVFERFIECGGRPSIRFEHRPHLGSNRLPMLVRNFRRKIEALGGEYLFRCRLESLDVQDGQVRGIGTSSGYMPASVVVLAIGHSARDTYHMLHDAGLPLEAKAFQLGLRIEQPQENVNDWKYGRDAYAAILGAADYTVVAHGPTDVFSFCMCAGGWVIPSVAEPERFCTNGMSNSRHETPFANSGLVVTLDPSEFGSPHPLAGVHLQAKYEAVAYQLGKANYLCPAQRGGDFIKGKSPQPGERIVTSYQRGTIAASLDEVVPPSIAKAIRAGLPIMDRKFRGRFLKDAVLVGPEMRGSSPVRIDRDPVARHIPQLHGLYPVGEGAGYAGGIVSAAVDGLRTAKAIVQQFAPVG